MHITLKIITHKNGQHFEFAENIEMETFNNIHNNYLRYIYVYIFLIRM